MDCYIKFAGFETRAGTLIARPTSNSSSLLQPKKPKNSFGDGKWKVQEH